MMEFEILAQPRTDVGTAAIRRLRRTGRIPAIVYGTGKEPQTLQIEEHYLRKQLENEAIFSHILNLNTQGQVEQVVIKDLQRHPATSRVTHLDFLRISVNQAITLQIPLHFENEEIAPGVRQGGKASYLLAEVEITCLPKDLPESITVDMSEMKIGDTILLSQLAIPSEVTVIGNDRSVVAIQAARGSTQGAQSEESSDTGSQDSEA